MTDERQHGRAHVMSGGEVDGTQYYVVHVRNLMGDHESAALPEEDFLEFIDEAQQALRGGQ